MPNVILGKRALVIAVCSVVALGLAPTSGAAEDITSTLDPKECTASGFSTQQCGEVAWTRNTPSPNYTSARVDRGASVGPIDVPADANGSLRCRYVTNHSPAAAAFVPFKTWQEWDAFTQKHPDAVFAVDGCSRPTLVAIAPSTCSSVSGSHNVDLPYARLGVTYAAKPAFVCSGKKLERTNVTFIAGAAADAIYSPGSQLSFGTAASGWTQSVPVADVGGCGSADGTPAPAAPATNLCLGVSTASTVTSDGTNWNWNCSLSGSELSPSGSTGATLTASVSCTSLITASCGSASTWAVAMAPTTNLCAQGTASAVSGAGPWSWTCTKGASTASCTAPTTIVASCGSSSGTATTTSPTTNLCSGGTASAVSGTSPFTWTCTGSTIVNCSAPLQPSCGSANNVAVLAAPSTNLCAGGSAAGVTGSGPWSWTCAEAALSASCSAPLKANASCGTANGIAVYTAPLSNLCAGGTATAVAGTGPFTWTCNGEGGGTNASCSAPLKVNGACGTANNVAVLAKPTSNLCSKGTASAVAGTGGWTWSCSGVNGGTAASCSAPLKVNGVCGAANGVSVTTKPTSNFCTYGTASAVAGTGPWTWSCGGLNGGTAASCSAPKTASNPTCGSAANVTLSCPVTDAYGSDRDVPAPSSNLCGVGTASAVSFYSSSGSAGSGDKYYYAGQFYYKWTCTSSGTTITCTTPSCSCAMCGWAHDNTSPIVSPLAAAPSANLCLNGSATAAPVSATSNPYVSGTKWWRWNCKLTRTNGTTNSHDCYAPRQ